MAEKTKCPKCSCFREDYEFLKIEKKMKTCIQCRNLDLKKILIERKMEIKNVLRQIWNVIKNLLKNVLN